MKPRTKTILLLLATGLIGSTLFTKQAQADQINGAITFSGSATYYASNNPGLAIGVQTFLNPRVEVPSGDFATFVSTNDPVAFSQPWAFNSGPVMNFWSVGGFTFDLQSSSILAQFFLSRVVQGVFVSGTGFISGNGFESTFGTFTFSSQGPPSSGTFSFSAGSMALPTPPPPSVPEGGSAIALLGLALAAVEGLRRTLKASRA